MESATIVVQGPADRLVMAGLEELRPLFRELDGSVVIVGGLMTRVWVHARPSLDLPARATVDVDLGIDRKGLRLGGDLKIVEPLLSQAEFEKGMGDNAFQFTRQLDEGEFRVDVMVPPGHSRDEPPLVERGVPSIAVPGLAYALLRGPHLVSVEFVDRDRTAQFDLPLPRIDAAFVMKASLVTKGSRRQRIAVDTADAVTLAALCVSDDEGIGALQEHQSRNDVKQALAFLQSMDAAGAASAQRVERHFESEDDLIGMGEWAVRVAQTLLEQVRQA